MAYGQPIRIHMRGGQRYFDAKVVKRFVDPARVKRPMPHGASWLVVVLEDGTELAVDSIDRVSAVPR